MTEIDRILQSLSGPELVILARQHREAGEVVSAWLRRRIAAEESAQEVRQAAKARHRRVERDSLAAMWQRNAEVVTPEVYERRQRKQLARKAA